MSYRDRNIQCLQALACWVTDMTLLGKIIDLNKFKADIIADDIADSRLDFEVTIDGKGERSNTKEFLYEKLTQWEDNIYNYFTSIKKSRALPYLTLSERILQVPKIVISGMCK